MSDPLSDPARRAAATVARERIEPGMTIGLGSGRAVFALIDLLATTWSSPEPLRAVAASARTEARARAAGIELVLAAARAALIVAEAPKLVDRLGATRPLPVEVVRFAWPTTRRRLLDLVPEATLRRTETGDPVITDEGHHLLDCAIPDGDLSTLAAAVKATIGVVEHGFFPETADEVLLGAPDGSVRALRR
jgi:ribose 5-phosphate isomerase A